ncbi:MAG TPA: amino acid permease [Bryobacteraceae bacterium]|nr:amino acid permease [Bryobacteraceae bacterium]
MRTEVPDKTSTARRPIPDLTSKPVTLLRQLGVVSATAIVISNMIGTGIFTTTGFLAGDLGDPKLVLGIWVVGALVALAGAFCYSELGINFPSSGGEYVYLTRAYGPTWGFMTGWVSFFAGFSAAIAVAALAFSDYLGYFFPALKQENVALTVGSGAWSLKLGGAQVAASVMILVLTAVNCIGTSRVAKLQNLLTATKLIVLFAFIGLGVVAGTGSWEHLSMPAVRTSSVPVAAQFAISLFWIYVCYSGWNAATYVAEELKGPERTLPIALTFGTIVVAALYLALNVVFLYALPLEKMKGVVAIGSVAAVSLFGPQTAGFFSLLMALSLVATVNAEITIGPRVYYAMAQNRAFFKAAAHVHPKWRTPVVAILCQGLCAALMTVTPFPSLVIYIGFSLTFFAVLSVASLFIFRRRPNWQRVRVVSFAWPLVPLTFILVGVWTIIYGVMLQPKVSLAAVLTIATGAAVYHFKLRRA